MSTHKTVGSVFNDLGFNQLDAEHLKMRAKLMRVLEARIIAEGLTQAQAAEILHVTQPRVSDLLRGKIDRFTVDMLITMLARFGVSVELHIDDSLAA